MVQSVPQGRATWGQPPRLMAALCEDGSTLSRVIKTLWYLSLHHTQTIQMPQLLYGDPAGKPEWAWP